MIYCPKCGTANRDGSRFCNECGQQLGAHTRVRCPQCGVFNSIQNVFCDNCGGRLLPAHGEAATGDAAAPIKGLSLPTKASSSNLGEDTSHDSEDEDEEIPGWLRELGSSWSLQGASEAADGEADEIPDWLQDLRELLPDDQDAGLEAEDPDEVPAWLAVLQRGEAVEEPTQEGAAPQESTADDLPDSLSGMTVGGGAEAEEEEELPVEDEEKEGLQGSTGDLPDWLGELRNLAGGAEPAPQEPDLPTGNLPDWLAELRAQVPGDEPAEHMPGTPEPADAGVPEWLAELRGEAADVEVDDHAPHTTPDLPGADLPDWLAAMRPEATEGPEKTGTATMAGEEAEQVSPGGDVPDWFAELRSSAHESSPSLTEDADVPDRLAALEPGEEHDLPEPPPSSPPEQAGEAITTGQIPDWLSPLRPPGLEELEPGALEVEAVGVVLEPPSARPPDWLDEAGGPAQFPDEGLEEGELEFVSDEIPDWLVPAEGEFEEETLARAEIPEWLLALKPSALREAGEPEGPDVTVEEPVEEKGILAGIRGTLPVEMLIAQPRAVTTPPVVTAPVSETGNARLFAEIVGRSVEPAPRELARPPRRLLSFLPRWLIYLALIGVVALPLVAGEPLLVRDVGASLPVQAMYSGVQALDENSVVLVAFDYDPSSSGEMDILARTVLGHVMDRGARVVVVSTLPAGPATAQMVLDDLAAERPRYAGLYGERYANLGYVPGQAAAVRLLTQSLPLAVGRDFYAKPLGDLPALEGVVSAASFDVILELAATQETLRWWIEQAGAPYGMPVAAGVSGAVEPFARAYFQADPPQLLGLVPGIPGAVSYDALASGDAQLDMRLAARLDSQLGGHLVFIAVLLIGAVIGLLRRDTGREA